MIDFDNLEYRAFIVTYRIRYCWFYRLERRNFYINSNFPCEKQIVGFLYPLRACCFFLSHLLSTAQLCVKFDWYFYSLFRCNTSFKRCHFDSFWYCINYLPTCLMLMFIDFFSNQKLSRREIRVKEINETLYSAKKFRISFSKGCVRQLPSFGNDACLMWRFLCSFFKRKRRDVYEEVFLSKKENIPFRIKLIEFLK